MMNISQRRQLWKFAVYGPPGAGKTHLALTMEDPFVMLSERQGFETLRTAAVMLGKPVPPTIWIRKLDQLVRITNILATNHVDPLAQMIRDPKVVFDADLEGIEDGVKWKVTREEAVAALPYVKPKSLSVDSGTELGDMFGKLVDEQGGKEVKDGLEFRRLQAWGPIEEKVSEFMRRVRDLPYHVLFICLLNERNHGTNESPDMRYEPMLPGKKLPKKLASMMNAVGLVRISKQKVGSGEKMRYELRRSVLFVLPDTYMQKCATPLRNQEVPDVGAWIEALSMGKTIESLPHAVVNSVESESGASDTAALDAPDGDDIAKLVSGDDLGSPE